MTRVALACALPAMAALALAACTPPHPHAHVSTPFKTIGKLDCPTSQGALSLKSAAPDGQSCAYTGPDGAQVTLQLISLQGGDVQSALQPLTADLRAELPAAAANKSAMADKDNVDIDLPGIHIHAHDHEKSASAAAAMGSGPAAPSAAAAGANASVSVGDSDDAEASNVHIGGDNKGVVIDAGDNGAEIHISKGGAGANLVFILASDSPGPHGYKFVSYEARGPQSGPLAVVSVKSPGGNGDNDDLRHDMDKLLRRNVGG